MSIYLAKDSGGVDAYSEGDNTDPVVVALTLDGSNDPTTVTGQPATDLFLYAEDDTTNIDNYSAIELGISGSDTGITWELSANGSTGWGATLPLSDLDVSSTAQAVQVYVRATALNDGSVLTANYTVPKISLVATENPAA